ncbi:unnamed protein product [Effrenium voratum]|nr:unnamed protein product [Effrenium voratum]
MALLNPANVAVLPGVLQQRRMAVIMPLALVILMVLKRLWRGSSSSLGSKARGTLLTGLRVSGRQTRNTKQVADALLQPLERLTQNKRPESLRSVVHDFTVFKVGDRVQHTCGSVGTVMSIDEDGDLRVVKTDNTITVWFGSKCAKTLSLGDRVGHSCGQEGELIGFDKEGDVLVRRADGTTGNWYYSSCQRLLSVGDRVHYVCGGVATVESFDEDGDVKVHKPNGQPAVWFADRCRQGVGPLVEALDNLP